MKKDKGQGTEKGKAWLKREMRPYRPFILFLTALTVAGTLLSLAFAYLTRYLVNSASEKDGKRLILFAVILLSTLLLRILVQTAVKYLSEKGRAKISVELKNKLFFRTLRADYASFEKYHSGDLLNRFDSDVTEVAADSVNIFPAVAGMIVQCVGAVAALLTLDPLFTAIFVAGAAVVGILTALFRRKVMSYHREMTEAKGESRAFMQESLTSALTLKAYGTEEKSAEKSRGLLDIYYRKRMKRARFTAGMSGVFSLLGNAGFIFARQRGLYLCGDLVRRGDYARHDGLRVYPLDRFAVGTAATPRFRLFFRHAFGICPRGERAAALRAGGNPARAAGEFGYRASLCGTRAFHRREAYL